MDGFCGPFNFTLGPKGQRELCRCLYGIGKSLLRLHINVLVSLIARLSGTTRIPRGRIRMGELNPGKYHEETLLIQIPENAKIVEGLSDDLDGTRKIIARILELSSTKKE